MRALRRLLWAIVVLAAVLGLVGGVVYVKLASGLPPLQTSSQIVAQIARSVDGVRERTSQESGLAPLPFAVVPRELLAATVGLAFLAMNGCPDYLRSMPVGSLEFWLAVAMPDGAGSGGCVAVFASDVAARLRPSSREQQLVAADRLRAVLGRDDLFALWLSALPFEPNGPQGIEEAARSLFNKDPRILSWEEAGELVVASQLYDQVALCKNPPYLRHLRDGFLHHVGKLIPASVAALDAAAATPMDCETHLRAGGRPQR